MQPKDRKRFGLCLMAAAEMYGKPPSEAASSMWWNALSAYEIDGVERAFQAHIGDPDRGQFMPRPADIVRLIVGTSKDSSLVAWSKVDRAVRMVGPYASVTFDDPITMRVLQDMGGWTFLCAKDDDAWPFIGNEFTARYQGFRSRGEVPEHPARLVGITEAENARKGLDHRDFALIGDPNAAQRVLDAGTDRPSLTFARVGEALRLTNDTK
jgi:hypothetical protein